MMIITAIISIGVLVFIHEGGHFLASRLFGVRVTEFMLGLPGPGIGFRRGETKFGVTCIPLGGYAKVCGMTTNPLPPYLEKVLASLYKRGTATIEEVAFDCDITPDEADEALSELVEWGSAVEPYKTDDYNTYRTPAMPSKRLSRKERKAIGDCVSFEAFPEGSPREIGDASDFFESEYNKQYRSKPFWKKTIILLAGIAMNLLFAILVFLLVYSIIGFDAKMQDGSVSHITVSPDKALLAGFNYIGMTVGAIVSLFNPATAADTVSNSTSIVGIAYLSQSYFAKGISDALMFMAMISVSLGLMNLLPIPPLDGGRFVIEIVQKISGKNVPDKIVNVVSTVGVCFFIALFLIMANQDIQRIIFGNW